MIAVAGESLMDLIAEAPDRLIPVPGGAPFNLARILAWLGTDCTFISRLSADPYGSWLRDELEAVGTDLAVANPVAAPTTIAIAQIDAGGSADYRFYAEGTASTLLESRDLPRGVLQGARALALGGLGIVFEPTRSTLVGLAMSAPREVLLVLDPNCRPSAVADPLDYAKTIATLLSRAAFLKVSVQDIAFLAPGCPPLDYAERALSHGPGVAIVTDGPRPITLLTAQGRCTIPVPEVQVIDTIGAGDAFLAGLLAWLDDNPEVDPRAADLNTLRSAVETAAQVAAAICTTRGAILPAGLNWRERV